MSMFNANMILDEHIVEYLKKADIGRQAQIQVLKVIWEAEKDGWDPPHAIKKRLDYLTEPKPGRK